MNLQRPSCRALLVGACSALAMGAAPASALAAPARVPCPSARDAAEPAAGTQCLAVPVALDHSGRVPGTLNLAVARVPATQAKTGTLVILAGGPGQATVPLAGPLTKVLGTAREHYDLLYVDQRGTGSSDPVKCSSSTTAAAVRRCADALGARRPFWTTRETASDLEDVRLALGDERLTLYGVSYGAKVAGEFARRFPARTAGLVLDSPTPVDGLDTSLALRQLGLPRVLREVCFPPSCSAFVRDPTVAVGTLVRKLQRKPLRGRVVLPSGRRRNARLTADDVYGLVLLSDLDPALRAEIPAAVASGVLGDPAPLLRLLASVTRSQSEPGADPGINQARFLATSCLEGRLPWAPASPVQGREQALERAVASAPAATFAPFRGVTVLRASVAVPCLAWPSTPKPEGVISQGPDVPVLVLAGRDDLRTPLEDARRTAAQYPRARVLAVPGVGHSVLGSDRSGCASAGIRAFLAGGVVQNCTRSEKTSIVRAPFIPAGVAQLKPQNGVPGGVGRVATAARVTLIELSRALALSGNASGSGSRVQIPGLRGGSATVTRREVVLRSFEVIRGVRISGRSGTRSGRLTVTAPGAITGVLRTGRGDTVSGTLAGERVTFALR